MTISPWLHSLAVQWIFGQKQYCMGCSDSIYEVHWCQSWWKHEENIYSTPISIFIPMRTNHCFSMMEGVQYKWLAIIELTVPLHCSMISDLQTWSLLLKVRPLSAAAAASALEGLLDHLLDQVVSVPASKATLFLSRPRTSWGKKLIDVSSPTGWVIMSTWLSRTSSIRRAFWRASMWDRVGSASGSILTALSTLSFPDHMVTDFHSCSFQALDHLARPLTTAHEPM